MRDGQPRGFFWSRDTDGCINAWCQDCDDVLESAGGDWNDESEAFANIVLVCEGCAKRVAKINGLEVLD